MVLARIMNVVDAVDSVDFCNSPGEYMYSENESGSYACVADNDGRRIWDGVLEDLLLLLLGFFLPNFSTRQH
jgi:hypothetical protein